MASIKGITIDIGGNTSKLEESLKNVNNVIYSTNSGLKELNRALKIDPTNTDTLSAKQKLLTQNIGATVERLKQLKTAQEQMGQYSKLTDEQKQKYNNLSIEIAKSESNLVKMNKELDNTKNGDLSPAKDGIDKLGQAAVKVGDLIKANLASEAIIRTFDSVVGKIKDISNAIGNMVISGGIDRALNLENAKAKMSTFTKSTEQLDEIMNNVADSVDGTAFSMDSAATVAAGLFAAGIKEGDEMTNSLKLVGDAAQVSGRSMEEIGSIFNKVAANGKLSGDELNQLSDSGIPILQMLSDSTGKSTEEVRKLVSAGKIGFAEFSAAMEKGLGGAAQKSGETFTSSLANLKSALSRIGAELMTPLLEGITPIMNTTKDMIKNMVKGEDISEQMDTMFSQLETFADNVSTHLTEMSDKYIPVISEMLNRLIQMIPELLPKLIPVIVSLIQNVANLLLTNLPTLLNTLLQVIAQLAISLGEMLPTLIPQIIDCILDLVDTIIDNIDLLIDAGIQLILGLAEGLYDPYTIQKLMDKIPEVIIKIVDALIRNLPKLFDAGGQLLFALGEGFIAFSGKIGEWMNTIIDAIKEKLGNMGSMASEWGQDMMQGFIDGINNMLGKIGEAAKSVGNKIKNFLHFSRPDIGPLRDYETWMPDMIKGMVKGINNSSYLLENATDKMAQNMANNLSFNDILGNTTRAMKTLNYGVQNSLNPMINPNAHNLILEKQNSANSNNASDSKEGFAITINNNSKYTSPSENVRLLRQEYELYRLKYGGVR
jgi:tape measure domain-containing protein